MLLTKELAVKGSAILGSAGAGGTGLYYGGHYLNSMHKGSTLMQKIEETKDSHPIFSVQKIEADDDENTLSDLDGDTNDIKFEKTQSFVVHAVSTHLSSTNLDQNSSGQTIKSSEQVSCSFRFEVENNDYANKTIKQNYKNRIFWENTDNQKLGLFGLIQYPSNGYLDSTAEDKDKKWTKQEIVEIKKKFVETCGKHMTEHSNPKEEVVIKFKAQNGELVPSDMATFDKWFLNDQEKDKIYSERYT